MAISTYKVFLMKKGDTDYEKLIDIKDFPDLGGDPELLETTTLSDKMQTFIEGIQSSEALAFTANYTSADFKTLLELKGLQTEFAVWFGGTETAGVVTPTGSDGKQKFTGTLTVKMSGAEVNSVVEMVITIVPSTPIVFEE